MKTFNKAVVWSLVVMFSFLQIAPTGWARAAKPVDELGGSTVPASAEALTKPAVTPSPDLGPQERPVFHDSIEFQLGEGPLSPATREEKVEPVATSTESFDIQYKVKNDSHQDIKPLEKSSETPVNQPAVVIPTPSSDTVTTANVDLGQLVPKKLDLLPLPDADDIVVPKIDNKVGTPTTITSTVEITVSKENVITDPATGKKLSVAIDDHGIATVTWGNEKYKGFYDSRTNSIIIVTNDNSVWTLQYGKNEAGELYLQSFQTRKWNGNYSEETYTFNPKGQLIRKDWLREENLMLSCTMENTGCMPGPVFVRSGGTVDYVTINGKTLVGHEKTWSESNSYTYYDKRTGGMNSYSDRSETDTWYSYDSNGNLLAKNWNSIDPWGTSFGQETYVHINGKDLVSVRRTWQYGGSWGYYYDEDMKIDFQELRISKLEWAPYYKYVSYHSETYYNYDGQGNLLAEVNVHENYDHQGKRHTGGWYSVFNPANRTWEYASAEGIDLWTIRSWQDYKVIEAASQRKTVYVGGNGERWNYTHRVEYTRNADGTMTAKAVYDNEGYVSIVQGEPDILSGETNDIKLKDCQEVNGYQVYYEEYWHADENGNWVSDGYRLVFYGSPLDGPNMIPVDFPNQKTVELKGKKYEISVNQDGLIVLKEILPAIPPAVQAVVDALREQLGNMYQVSVAHVDGAYQVKIERNAGPGGSPVMGGVFCESLEFTLSADGEFQGIDRAVYRMAQGSVDVDANLLYEAMWQLFSPPSVNTNHIVWTVQLLSLLTVTKVENGAIFYALRDKNYKAYRDAANGRVIVEEIVPIPEAVQAVVDQLKAGMPWWNVSAALVPDSNPPRYQVTVSIPDGSIHQGVPALILDGGFAGMSFDISADGIMDVSTLQVAFQNVSVDSQLLFDGMKRLVQVQQGGISVGDQDAIAALALLTKITVKSVDADGAVHFTLGEKNYKAYHDAQGNSRLAEEIAVSPEILAKAKDILGAGVVTGLYLVEVLLMPVEGAASVAKFYDAAGEFLGSYTRNASVGPRDTPTWRDGTGRVVMEERSDGSNVRYFYGDMNRIVNVAFTWSDGRQVAVNLDYSNANHYPVDIKAVEAAVIDLLATNGNIDSLAFKNYSETEVGACTNSIPPSCFSNITTTFDLGSGAATYKYQVLIHSSTGSETTYEVQLLTPSIPPAAQAFADDLQAGLGHAYIVRIFSEAGNYRITVDFRRKEDCAFGEMCPEVIYMPVNGQLTHLSFVVNASGDLVGPPIAAYEGVEGVDGKLLFGAVKQILHDALCNGIVCADRMIMPQEVLAAMVRINVQNVDLGGKTRFTLDGKEYMAYLDVEGNVKLEQIVPIPPAVQAFADDLQQQLGSGFKVTVRFQVNGKYRIEVADVKRYVTAPAEGLKAMSFEIVELTACQVPGDCRSAGWIMDQNTLLATYYGPAGDLQVDAKLLYEAMQLLRTENPGSVALLALIHVTSVDAGRAIYFTLNMKRYVAFRDATGAAQIKWIIDPMDPYLPYIAKAFRIAMEDIESYKILQEGGVCLGTGCASWNIEVEARVWVNGELRTMTGWVAGPPWDAMYKIVYPEILPEKSASYGLVAEEKTSPVEELSGSVSAPKLSGFSYRLPRFTAAASRLAWRKGGYSRFQSSPAMAVRQSTSLKASPVFGFERSILFGDILTELTK